MAYSTYALAGETVLKGAVPLAGTSAGTSADTGTLTTAFASVPLAGTSAGGSSDTGTLTALTRVPLAGTSAGTSSDTGALTAVPAKHTIVRILSSTGWLDLSPIVGYYSTN